MKPISRKRGMSSPGARRLCAFTLTELIVLLAVIGLLLTLHLSAATHSRAGGAQSVCMSNLRRLTAAWHAFANDHQDNLPGNLDGGDAQAGTVAESRTWCVGWLDFSSRPDNTNTAFLSGSQLGSYLGTELRVFKCPSDLSSVTIGGKAYPRVRSVSMNAYMGNRLGPYTSGYRQFKTLTDVSDPAPVRALVFLDERDDSINDGWFVIDMTGFDPPHASVRVLVDAPGDYHEGSANFSFADGHVEAWHWRDPRTTPPHRRGQLLTLGINMPNNPDIERIQSSASSKIR